MARRNANPSSTPNTKGSPNWGGAPPSGSGATSPRAGDMGLPRPAPVPATGTDSMGLSGPAGAMPCEDMAYGDSPDNDYDD